jgi:ketosteroid isomerase-like protein
VAGDNADLVRRAYEALNRGDWDGLFETARADFELTTQRGLNAGTNRGRDAARSFLEDYSQAFAELAWEPEELRVAGEEVVVVVVTTRARPAAGSAEITTRNGHLWTIRGGKLASMKTFPDPNDALAAAGVGE